MTRRLFTKSIELIVTPVMIWAFFKLPYFLHVTGIDPTAAGYDMSIFQNPILAIIVVAVICVFASGWATLYGDNFSSHQAGIQTRFIIFLAVLFCTTWMCAGLGQGAPKFDIPPDALPAALLTDTIG